MHGSQMIYATALILLAGAGAPRSGQPASYTCDPVLTRLFSPAGPSLGHYEVCTTAEPIPEEDGEALEALDAFGTAGTYRRSVLARLYGGRRVRVERRWTDSPGRFESVTRLSPYPDATLSRLISGTMEIRFTLSRVGRVGREVGRVRVFGFAGWQFDLYTLTHRTALTDPTYQTYNFTRSHDNCSALGRAGVGAACLHGRLC